jgi:tetratricopeptide (TPR) repeat protein
MYRMRVRLAAIAGFCCAFQGLSGIHQAAAAPSAVQALGLTPIQPNVSYSQPTKEEAESSTIRAEKQGNITAWVVRNGRGETLRRFADTNGDNVVDLWCYFDDGLESYRDIDSDYNGKADQYRWFQASGTRWGLDKNEDGKIDSWKVISAPEVAEELVFALKNQDKSRFELLLITPNDLATAGFGPQQEEQLEAAVVAAPAAFAKLAGEQKALSSDSEFSDFYRTRPATIPIGTEGSTKDITIYDNASALVTTGKNHDQLYLGTLVAVGDTWKLLDAPTIGTDNEPMPQGMLTPNLANSAAQAPIAGGPNEEMQKLMGDLEKLDQQAMQANPSQQGPITDRRAELLLELADKSNDPDMRGEWIRQLADMLSGAAQDPSANYAKGLDQLDDLAESLAAKDQNDPLVSYVKFRRMYADYALSQQSPNPDFAKIQEKWLADLETFANENSSSPDAAEAMLQLGMSHEFAGQTDKAKEWYQRLVKQFPNTPQAKKASGVLGRLSSIGKPLRFKAKDIRGRAVDIAAYRGRVVLIQFWSTIDDRAKDDMDTLKDLHAKYGGNRGFEVIGICLDRDPKAMQAFIQQNKYLWPQIQEAGGFEGPLANELGVMTLPMMILVDQKGNVVTDNIFVANLEGELKRLLGTTTAQGAAGSRSR